MKNKNIYIIVVTIVAIILLAVVIFLVISNQNNREIISEEEALTIALNQTGTTRDNVTVTTTNRDNDDRKYEIEFYDDNYEYDVEIDMTTGRVIKIEKDVRSGNIVENNNNDNQITLDEAKTIALEYLNLNIDEVTFTKNKLDFEDGNTIYELEFYSTDTSFEVDINAYNKEIIRVERNVRNNNNTNSNSNNYIGSTRAMEIALEHAGISGNVVWERTEFDFDNNVAIYEVEFYYNNIEYNYEINAINGNIIKYEIDRDY